MNRRTIVGVTAIASIGVFAAGWYLYTPADENSERIDVSLKDTPLIRPHAPAFGPVDAPVTIVEFFDPACEACRAFHPVVKQILAAFPKKVRVVLRYAAFHAPSEQAIRVLEASRLQGKFEVVLERLLETQPSWAPHGQPAKDVWSVLDGTGLDLERAKSDAQSPDIVELLDKDAEDIKAVGVEATPTFFVNGKPLQEFGAQQLYDLVKTEVEAS